MAMHYQLKIALAFEIPTYDEFEQYEDEGFSIFTEGEAGDRMFLGKLMKEFGPDSTISGEVPLVVEDGTLKRLADISSQHGLNEPELWGVGAIL